MIALNPWIVSCQTDKTNKVNIKKVGDTFDVEPSESQSISLKAKLWDDDHPAL